MASLVLTDAFISVNAVDLSDHGNQVSIDFGPELKDATAFSHTTKGNKAGLKDWTVTINFWQDYAASKVDATVFPLVNGGTEFAFIIRPTSAAVSATNPNYTSTGGLISSYNPISGQNGEMLGTQITIRPGVNAALTRATA